MSQLKLLPWMACVLATLVGGPILADVPESKRAVGAGIDARADAYSAIALEIWKLAEVGYQEEQSSMLLQNELTRAGFTVETGVAGMPTAFIASWGSGSPVIAILAEFDALPGLSQEVAASRQPVIEGGAGHGCGHHLFGTASIAAGVAIRQWLADYSAPGTIKVYGTPAEEGGSGKVYLARDGFFEGVDVVLHWHPGDRNRVNYTTSLANKSAKFRFHGQSAHAAGAPERGRSALDGVEAMNYMVNLLREHVPQETRIHYVITRGGGAPNVVPDFAEVYYYVRHPDPGELGLLWDRVVGAAEAAALGTETGLDYEVIHGNLSLLPNETLARLIDGNLRQVGGPVYDQEDLFFAAEIRETLGETGIDLESASQVQPFRFREQKGSTDVGDVSWVVPTGGFNAACWVPGTAGHSWQAVAAGGTAIGIKGMLVAAKTLAMSAIDLYGDPGELIERAREEFEERRGPDYRYEPLLGDRTPPLDYRR